METAEKEQVKAGEIECKAVILDAGHTSGGKGKYTLLTELPAGKEQTLRKEKLWAVCTEKTELAEDAVFTEGDVVKLKGEVAPFISARFPGGFDERLYRRTKGFSGKVFLSSMEKTGEEETFGTSLAKLRRKLGESIENALPEEEGGIMKAVLTGEREDIPESIRELYTAAGVSHILCISGLHLSVFALGVSLFLEKFLNRSRRVTSLVTMAVSWCFLLFTGFSPASVRAVLMLSVVLLGRSFFRASDRLNTLAAAAFLILLIQPLYLWNAGFQLSFMTVLGLCLAGEQIPKGEGFFGKCREAFLYSAAASVFGAPVAAYHFYHVSLAGLLANLFILPLSGLLLGFGMLSGVLGLFSKALSIFAAGSVYVILRFYRLVCLWVTKLPFAEILTGRPALLTILLFYFLLFLVLYRREKPKAWRQSALVSAALVLSVSWNYAVGRKNTAAFLDVGQGDAAVVSTYDKKAYLIDGGGIYGRELGENTGVRIVLPYLEYLGIEELDGIFLSHMDSDHITGVLEVLERIPVKGLYVSDYAFPEKEELLLLKETVERTGVSLYTVKEGDSTEDGAWQCLSPLEGISFADGNGNHGSTVLKYAYGGSTVLFTGDITGEDENILVRQKKDLDADVLKVPHHGSAYSSGEGFLSAVSPEAAVISAGERNPYGHPAEETLERLKKTGAAVYRTDEQGTILLSLSPHGTWEMKTMTEGKPFYERIKEAMEGS